MYIIIVLRGIIKIGAALLTVFNFNLKDKEPFTVSLGLFTVQVILN